MGADDTQTDGPAMPAAAAWTPITRTFEDHVRRHPDALAVEARGQSRTYAELAARIEVFAARIASRLHNGDRLVGVCLERDIDLPAWLLAIHKVGGAYCPIDPTTPPARIAHMIEDARPALIVASRRHAGVVAGIDAPVIIAEDVEDVPPAPLFTIRSDTLAYVIFTSGSTGRPKGVEIEHGALVALMATMAVTPGFARGERVLALTRISFDLSVPDLFLPFFAGGSLVLVDLDVAADPARLAAAFDTYRPDVVQGTPSTWRALLEAGWQGLPALRILAGGEAVTRALADRLMPCCGELWNMYGPTEATVWATCARVTTGDAPVPIGLPCNGVTILIATSDATPLPAGEVGEIVIGGIGVARGYRNRPELTADRFVVLADGTRAYRTGDLGRIDGAGALHCLGRIDDQVKVRGFRIELGDVEAALAGHPAVAWCAARVWNDPSGEPVLVAYTVPRQGTDTSARIIKAFLATRVAPYMIPDRIVTVAALPLTPNGKVDRASLPDPFAGSSRAPEPQPDDGIQPRLGAIWRELLDLASVDTDDDFFDLGGYSLMTVRLARRIDHAFGVTLAPIDLLQHSTLATMAARIGRGEAAAGFGTMLLNTAGHRPPLYWLDAGPLMRAMMRGLSLDQPAFALNTDAADEEALAAGGLSIQAIAARLRPRLVADQPSGPYYLGGWCRWGIVAYELARQLVDDGKTVALLVLLDAERPGWRNTRPGLRSRLGRWLRPLAASTSEPPSFSQRVEIATLSYAPGRYAGDVLLLRSAASRDDAGWRSVIDGDIAVEHTPGDHVSMVRNPNVQVLAATLDRALDLAQRKATASADRRPIQTTSASFA